MGQHMTGQRIRSPEELGELAAERQRLTKGAPRKRGSHFTGASSSDPRRSQAGHDSRRMPGQEARPQHFDIGQILPPDLQPTNFRELEADKFEIMQFLINTQGMSRAEANKVLSDIEVDLMDAAA